MKLKSRVLQRLDTLLEAGEAVLRTEHRIEHTAGRWVDGALLSQWRTSCLHFLSRVLGESSEHYRNFPKGFQAGDVGRMIGVMKAAKDDIESGFLFDRDLLISADAFDDILDQAEHLLENKYRDAAAVLIGAALESTLRKMCARSGIGLTGYETIEPLNVKLAGQGVYNKLVQKQITAWADLRNNAAHGHFDNYSQSNVEDMDKWVRSFLEQHLA